MKELLRNVEEYYNEYAPYETSHINTLKDTLYNLQEELKDIESGLYIDLDQTIKLNDLITDIKKIISKKERMQTLDKIKEYNNNKNMLIMEIVELKKELESDYKVDTDILYMNKLQELKEKYRLIWGDIEGAYYE